MNFIQNFIDKLFFFFLKLSKKQQNWKLEESELKKLALKNQKKFEKSKFPTFFKRKNKIEIYNINNFNCYKITPKKNAVNKAIMYLPGGGAIFPTTIFHYRFINKILKQTNQTVYICNYPLAPKYKYNQVYYFCLKAYKIITNQFNSKDVTIMGDSAGGTIALSIASMLNNKKIRKPGKLILISPAIDIALDNPEISTKLKQDPFLSDTGPRITGKWISDNDVYNPKINPMYIQNLNGMPDTHIFVGSYDLLMPDMKRFYEKSKNFDYHIKLYEYPKMIHVFPLFYFKQSRESRKIIFELLNK